MLGSIILYIQGVLYVEIVDLGQDLAEAIAMPIGPTGLFSTIKHRY